MTTDEAESLIKTTLREYVPDELALVEASGGVENTIELEKAIDSWMVNDKE